MCSKSLVFTVISLLSISLIYSSFSTFYVFAVPADSSFNTSIDCTDEEVEGFKTRICCWPKEPPFGTDGVSPPKSQRYCQTCEVSESGEVVADSCGEALEQPPTPLQTGPKRAPDSVLPGSGVFQEPSTPTSPSIFNPD